MKGKSNEGLKDPTRRRFIKKVAAGVIGFGLVGLLRPKEAHALTLPFVDDFSGPSFNSHGGYTDITGTIENPADSILTMKYPAFFDRFGTDSIAGEKCFTVDFNGVTPGNGNYGIMLYNPDQPASFVMLDLRGETSPKFNFSQGDGLGDISSILYSNPSKFSLRLHQDESAIFRAYVSVNGGAFQKLSGESSVPPNLCAAYVFANYGDGNEYKLERLRLESTLPTPTPTATDTPSQIPTILTGTPTDTPSPPYTPTATKTPIDGTSGIEMSIWEFYK